MLNIISLIFGMGAWVVAAIAIAKPAYYNKSVILSFALCTFSLISEFFEISRRVNLGDYAAIEDTIRAVIIASIVLVVVSIILNIVALVKSKKKFRRRAMSKIKRSIIIIAMILTAMLIIPLITVNTVKSDAGMLVTMMLFFVVHPIVSIITGILAGKDIKVFWFTPILVSGLFRAFSSFTYVTAFPLVYSSAYLVICTISMLISWLVTRKAK